MQNQGHVGSLTHTSSAQSVKGPSAEVRWCPGGSFGSRPFNQGRPAGGQRQRQLRRRLALRRQHAARASAEAGLGLPQSNSRSSGRTGFLSGMTERLATSRGMAFRMSARQGGPWKALAAGRRGRGSLCTARHSEAAMQGWTCLTAPGRHRQAGGQSKSARRTRLHPAGGRGQAWGAGRQRCREQVAAHQTRPLHCCSTPVPGGTRCSQTAGAGQAGRHAGMAAEGAGAGQPRALHPQHGCPCSTLRPQAAGNPCGAQPAG